VIRKSILLLIIPLALSIFTYLWNPLGVIELGYDESTYIGNAMHLLVTHTPQESTFYNHPYFGQLFLGGVLRIMDYPNSLHVSAVGDVVNSVKMLWLVPRVIIGIMGVVDTFLVYKISERRYNTKIAFSAAVLFAVMPVTLLRYTFLESLQLPFLLSSVLFAVNVRVSKNINDKRKNESMTLLSGIFMGLAIFTKIPVFMMIPLVGFVIFSNSKSIKGVGMWFLPVILIPLIWPGYALVNGELGYWLDGIYYQTHRTLNITEVDRRDTFSSAIVKDFFRMPILLSLGFVGLAFAAVKKDFFLLLWVIPFLVFLYFIGLVRDFHLIPILPALCISASRLIADLADKLTHRKAQKILSFSIISAIAIIGLVNFVMLSINTNNDYQFEEVAFALRYLEENKNQNISTISTDVYSWIPKYVFRLDSDYLIPEIGIDEKPQNEKVLMVVEGGFRDVLSSTDIIGKLLRQIYNEHSKEGTTIVESHGLNKIVIPQAWPSNLTRYSGIELIDGWHVWKPNSNVRINISQSNKDLTILVNTKKTDEMTKYAFMRTQLKNLTKTPLLLSLDYSSKSPNSNTKYFVQIEDSNGQNRINLMRYLRDTSGNLTNNLFILPTYIVDTPIEFRLGIVTNSSGEHELIVKKASIIYPSSS